MRQLSVMSYDMKKDKVAFLFKFRLKDKGTCYLWEYIKHLDIFRRVSFL